MTRKVVYFFPTIALILFYTFWSTHPETQEQVVLRVLDGDTIELSDGSRVRLIGIDAPEIGKPFSREAKMFLEEIILGKKVIVKKDDSRNKDRYGRILGYVFLGEKLVNCEMVRLGLAESIAKKESKYYDCFQKAEQEAKERKVGIWSS